MGLFLYNGISLKNEDSAQKIGTDSILLGNWLSPLPTDRRLLDIGTGTGILSLLCAQKLSGLLISEGGSLSANDSWQITALEIDAPSCAEAQTNFASSPWGEHLEVLRTSLQDYAKGSTESANFDYIFTNPPYFIGSLQAPDTRRTTARHTSTLTYEEIIAAAFSLLRPGGRLALILPTTEAKRFTTTAELYHIGRNLPQRGSLKLTKKATEHPKRVMLEFEMIIIK